MTDSPADDTETPDGPDGEDGAERESYVFDRADTAVAVELVDEAFRGSPDHWDTVHRLETAAKSQGLDGTSLVAELVHAAGHGLVREPPGDAGCGLGRDREWEVLGWPRPIADAPGDAIELWRTVASAATEPAATARFEELLFARRDGNGLERVQRAVAAYLSIVDDADVAPATIETGTIDLLLRSWTIARSVGERDLDSQIRDRMVCIATAGLALNPVAPPGVVLPLLRALAAGPLGHGDDPHDIDALLTQAAGEYQRGDLAEQIATDRRSRAGGDPAVIDQIAHDEVDSYFAEADAAVEPAVRMHHLEAASRRALQLGLTDRARYAAAEMQKIAPSDLGMKRVSFSMEMPAWIPERELFDYTSGSSWRDGLRYFLSRPDPPSGSVENVRAAANASTGGISSLFSVTVFGHGLPRATSTTDSERDAHEMSKVASFSASMFGHIYAEGLDRMASRYGVPPVDGLTAALIDEGCRDPQMAAGLAKAFTHYWNGDFESACAVATPKFEAAARSLLRELDEGIYRVQRGKDPGGYVGLYVLLDDLETIALDPSWAYFFRWLLLGPHGANLRNDIAHGFVFDPGPAYTALLLRAVAVLCLAAGPLPHDSLDSDSDDDDPSGRRSGPEAAGRTRDELTAALRHPTGPPSLRQRAATAVAGRLERIAWRIRARSDTPRTRQRLRR